ncbi:hypothetical protein AMJ44_02025 [candidate division WOR-1 bacterium DG_54_3]|uniref:Translation elongation factor-like protein n=1 Tax=candidate division WOR-1 bacterium DG_54_3 TaxID=1703775 RepID=A0A0S7Y6K7_UNCSA|nr:MAG: hypothetical protein AMJ44_02025 [candidate division WOR-1 bacterium DG_54_3]
MRTIEGTIREIRRNDKVLLKIDKETIEADARNFIESIKIGQKVIAEYEDVEDMPKSCRIIGFFSVI